MYSVIFSDNTKFSFTKEQIMLIPYFNVLISSSSFLEKETINVLSSSIGFEYIHIYATMNEIDIIDPLDKYPFAIKQCDYFGYDKLKILLEEKYGYKTDIKDTKEKIGTEISIKIKYLGKIQISRRLYPVIQHRTNNIYLENSKYIPKKETLEYYYDEHIYNCHTQQQTSEYYTNFRPTGITYLKKNKCSCGIICKNTHMRYGDGNCNPTLIQIFQSNFIDINNVVDLLYQIEPIYEYPNYSTDNEMNELWKARYRSKYNVYFVKMIRNIISFNEHDVICAKLKNLPYRVKSQQSSDGHEEHHKFTFSYKLLSEISEDEYQKIECIIVNNEPEFNNKYLIKHNDSLNNEKKSVNGCKLNSLKFEIYEAI